MASFYRRNVFQKEQIDEEREKESLKKKQEYQKMLMEQIEEQKNRKQREKEELKRLEREQEQRLAKEYEEMNQRMQQRLKQYQTKGTPIKNGPSEVAPNPDIPQPVQVPDLRKSMSKDSRQMPEPVRKRAKRENHSLNPQKQRSSNVFSYKAEVGFPVHEMPTGSSNYQPSPSSFLKRSPNSAGSDEQIQNQIEDYINRQIDNLHLLATSSQNFINTSLSKNYVMKHKEIKDYNTLLQTEDCAKPSFHYKNYSKFYGSGFVVSDTVKPSQNSQVIMNLQAELKRLTEQAIKATKERDLRHLEYLKLKTEFQKMQNDELQKQNSMRISLQKAKNAEEEDHLLKSYMPSNMSIPLDCETNYMPIEGHISHTFRQETKPQISKRQLDSPGHPQYNFKKFNTEENFNAHDFIPESKTKSENVLDRQGIDSLFPTQRLPSKRDLQYGNFAVPSLIKNF